MIKLRHHTTTLTAAIALSAAVLATGAAASPPSGTFTFTEHARAQVVGRHTLGTPGGTGVTMANYQLQPGASSGWQTSRGPMVLAVTDGTLSLSRSDGCTSVDYPAGKAALLPAGSYLARNAGTGPVEMFGAFLDPAAADEHLFAGAPGPAPEACAGTSATAATAAPGGVIDERVARGILVNTYEHTDHAPAAGGFTVEDGKDMFVSTYHIDPGTSGGWNRHHEAIAMVTAGTFTYYEEHDGKCMEAGRYGPGDAYIHAAGANHLAANEGTDKVELTILFFNLPHRPAAPVVGNHLEAIDFSPLPPAGCPRLR